MANRGLPIREVLAARIALYAVMAATNEAAAPRVATKRESLNRQRSAAFARSRIDWLSRALALPNTKDIYAALAFAELA